MYKWKMVDTDSKTFIEIGDEKQIEIPDETDVRMIMDIIKAHNEETEPIKYAESTKFAFPVDTDREEVVEWLVMAVVDAEMTLGTKEEIQYTVSPKNRTVEIDTSNESGKHVAKIFGELVARAKYRRSLFTEINDLL